MAINNTAWNTGQPRTDTIAVQRGIAPTRTPSSPTGPTANPYETTSSTPSVRSGSQAAYTQRTTPLPQMQERTPEQQWDQAWMNGGNGQSTPVRDNNGNLQPPVHGGWGGYNPNQGFDVGEQNPNNGQYPGRDFPPYSPPYGGINPSETWMQQNRSTGQQTSATPQYFNSQPGQNDIQAYYNSRGIAPRGNSVNYWTSKYPELVARGRQLDPSSDGTWYFNKFLSNAEEFTGGPRQTAYNMWGNTDAVDGALPGQPANTGIGPSNNGLAGMDPETQAAFMEFLRTRQQTAPYNRQGTSNGPRRQSNTQIRQGI